MPVWVPIVVAILQNLPTIVAVIEQIISGAQAANRALTVEEVQQLAAYSAMVDGMNQVLQFHINP